MHHQSYFKNVFTLLSGLVLLGLTSCMNGPLNPSNASNQTEKSSETVDLLSEELAPQWIQKGGQAKFEIVDGVLVGMSRPNTQNSFFCPPKSYSDFELQFEVKCEPRLNSGVQIRSKSDLSDLNDKMPEKSSKRIREILGKEARMFGPQVEISANGNAGGIWFEVGRGWISKPDAERGKTIYKSDDWNHYRVIAEGPRIQVFLNGEQITDVVDEVTHMREGYLGFQVHSVGFDDPSYVKWRNITLRELTTD